MPYLFNPRPTIRLVAALAASIIFSVVALHPHSSSFAADAKLKAAVDRQVKPYLDAGLVMGLSVVMSVRGEDQLFHYGQLSKQHPGSPTDDTVYEIGSVTKVFTGILLADAVANGGASLDQPAAAWLPAGVTMAESPTRPITLQDLATHVSGLPRLPNNLKPDDPGNPYASYSVDQLHAFLEQHTPSRPPGSTSEYSNLAQGLLGHLLATHAKTSYEQLIRTRLAGPLDMGDTTITLSDDQRRRLAPPYRANLTPDFNWDIPTLAGAGALRSTPRDMLRFARANLHPADDELGSAINLAWKQHQAPIGPSFAMGLGWRIARDGSTRWHNGQTGGYHSALFVNRKLDSAVAVLTNTATGEVDRLAEDLLRLAAGVSVTPRKFDAEVKIPLDIIKRYAGTYQLAPGMVFTVTVEDGDLMVQLTGQPSFQVYAKSERVWFYKVVEATLTFEVDRQGNCTAVELFQNGVRQRAPRI